MDIRAELKDLMQDKNYSMTYVATATGLAKSTISMWLMVIITGKTIKLQMRCIILYSESLNALPIKTCLL